MSVSVSDLTDEDSFVDYNRIAEGRQCVRLAVDAARAGRRLDQAVAELMPDFSRSRIQAWIKAGRVLLNGRPAAGKQAVWAGDEVSVSPEDDPEALAFAPEAMPLDIVHADEAVFVVNKPAALVVHPGSGNWSGTLLNGLLHHDPALAQVPRAGIVHRLDKDTTGLMVVARTIIAQTDLVRQLQARTVKREYLALAQGYVQAGGTVDAAIGRHPRERTRMALVADGKEAVTHYEPVEYFAGHTLVRCRLETGRTHQIRVHMQSIGHPLAADPVYGGRALPKSPAVRQALAALGRQALHAAELGLLHPTSRAPMRWQAPMPADMQQLIDILRAERETDDFA